MLPSAVSEVTWSTNKSPALSTPLMKGISTLSNCAVLEADERNAVISAASGLIAIYKFKQRSRRFRRSEIRRSRAAVPKLLIKLICDQTVYGNYCM